MGIRRDNGKNNKRDNIIAFNQDHEFLYRIAVKRAEKRDFDEAIKYIDKALHEDKYNSEYLFSKACFLVEKRMLDESIDVLNDILWKVDPTYAECYFGLGCNYFEKGDYEWALFCFEKYVDMVDEGEFLEDAYEILVYMQFSSDNGEILLDKKQINKIRNKSAYRKSSTKLDEDGRRFLFSGKYYEAIKKLEKSIRTYPETISARVRLSMAYYMVGDSALAKSLASSVLKLQKSNYLARLCLAFYYSADGQYDMSDKMVRWLEKVKGSRYSNVKNEAQIFYDMLVTKAAVGDSFKELISAMMRKIPTK